MGSKRAMGEFNYFFKQTPHGIICAHTYQYEKGKSTWVFAMDEACWQGHGVKEADEGDARRNLEALYAQELDGHGLLLNRSHWRRFPRIFCENWSHKDILFLCDAEASAPSSIGAGPKLAMECAIGLSDGVIKRAETGTKEAFPAY